MVSPSSRPVVVGVDGSKAAIRAALWAVDEAAGRDVPLRLLYSVEQEGPDGAEPEGLPGKLAAAETAIHRAVTAIESTEQPVKIESEIVQGPPIRSLIRASASAAMICVGAVGLRHFRPGRVGSTATALAVSAQCPVAIVRGRDNRPGHPADVVVVEVDGSPDNGVLLGAAAEEALLRHTPIHTVICRPTGAGRTAADAEGDRRALADLQRRLARWKRRYPHLRVESTTVPGTLVDYLARDRRSVPLVIIGARDSQHVKELVGPEGSAVLHDADCSLLIVNRQHH
jgi:nucleotide-binding universal stress UspA family protein